MTTLTEAVAELLADPNAVHLNMLRGTIAKPTPEQMAHVYAGDMLTREQHLSAIGAVLAEAVAAAETWAAETFEGDPVTVGECIMDINPSALAALDQAVRRGREEGARDWRPPTDRKDGYRCLGWVRGDWHKIEWEYSDWWWLGGRTFPTDFAPLPEAPARLDGAHDAGVE